MKLRDGLAALAVVAAACARPMPPPGGEEDREPPQIVATEPEPLAVVPDFAGAVTFQFHERISERNIERSVLVSPATGEARADHERSAVRVRIEGGWRPGLVYRVVLLPGVSDMFGNERRTPAELVFSTGPEIPDNALAGIVTDRITGQPASEVIVEATSRADSVVYLTTADTAAFFALQHLPEGQYDVRAYVDQNTNRRYDPSESVSAVQEVTFASVQDTVPLTLAVLPPDTTAAQVTRAEARDTVEIRLIVDDYIDPDIPLSSVQVSLFTLPDTIPVPGNHRLMSPDSFSVLARARGDTVPTDTMEARVPAPPEPEPLEPTEPLPFRELVFVPTPHLPPERPFLLRIEGLTNISGIPGGGGAVEFETPPRRPPPDTTAVPVDTTAVRRDTTFLRPRR